MATNYLVNINGYESAESFTYDGQTYVVNSAYPDAFDMLVNAFAVDEDHKKPIVFFSNKDSEGFLPSTTNSIQNSKQLDITTKVLTMVPPNSATDPWTATSDTYADTMLTVNYVTNSSVINLTGFYQAAVMDGENVITSEIDTSVTFNNTSFTNSGTVNATYATINATTGINESGANFNLTNATFSASGTITNAGTFTLNDNAEFTVDEAVSFENTGTFYVKGGSSVDATFSGNGTINLEGIPETDYEVIGGLDIRRSTTGSNNYTVNLAAGATTLLEENRIQAGTINVNRILKLQDKNTLEGNLVLNKSIYVEGIDNTIVSENTTGSSAFVILRNDARIEDSTVLGAKVKLDDALNYKDDNGDYIANDATISGSGKYSTIIARTKKTTAATGVFNSLTIKDTDNTATEEEEKLSVDTQIYVGYTDQAGKLILDQANVEVHNADSSAKFIVHNVAGNSVSMTDSTVVADSLSIGATAEFTVGGESTLKIANLSGTINVLDNAVISDSSITGGKVVIADENDVEFDGKENSILSTITNNGNITVNSGSTLTATTINNNGTLTAVALKPTGAVTLNVTTFNNAGTFTLTSDRNGTNGPLVPATLTGTNFNATSGSTATLMSPVLNVTNLTVADDATVTVKGRECKFNVTDLDGTVAVEGATIFGSSIGDNDDTAGKLFIAAKKSDNSDNVVGFRSKTEGAVTTNNIIDVAIENNGTISLVAGDLLTANGGITGNGRIVISGANAGTGDDDKSYHLVAGSVGNLVKTVDGFHTVKKVGNTDGLWLSKNGDDILYVNSAYTGDDGTIINNHIVGYNAFGNLADAMSTAKAGVTIQVDSANSSLNNEMLRYVFAGATSITTTEEDGVIATIGFKDGDNGLMLNPAASVEDPATAAGTLTIGEKVTIKTTGEGEHDDNGAVYLNFDGTDGKVIVNGNIDAWNGIKIYGETEINGNLTVGTSGKASNIVIRSGKAAPHAKVTFGEGATITGADWFRYISGDVVTNNAAITVAGIKYDNQWSADTDYDTTAATLTSNGTKWTIGAFEAAGDKVTKAAMFSFKGGNVNVSGDANLGDKVTLRLSDVAKMTVDGTVTNAGTLAITNSEFSADKVVNTGYFYVAGESGKNKITIGDLDGELELGKCSVVYSNITDKAGTTAGIVKTADDANLYGLNTINATIQNDVSLTVRANATLTGANIINKNNGTAQAPNYALLKVAGVLDGVTVNGGVITTEGGFTFTGASALNGVTITNTGATITVTNTADETLSVDTKSALILDKLTFTNANSTLTINAAEGFTGTTMVIDLVGENQAKLANIQAGNGLALGYDKANNDYYVAKIEGDAATTLYVDGVGGAFGAPVEGHVGFYYGFNAFKNLDDITQTRAANLNAEFPTVNKILFAGNKNYEAASNAGYYTNGNVTLSVETAATGDNKDKATILTNERFYLMHAVKYVKVGDTYKLMDGDVDITTAESYQAPIFTLETGKTLAINNGSRDGLLMIGDTLDRPEFEANPQDRTAGVAELDVNGTLNANVKLAPYSTVKISSTGKVQATSALNIGSYLRQHSLIQVNGAEANSTTRNANTQFDVSYLTYINGGDLELNNTNAQIGHIRFCDSGDISLLPSTDATITLDNTALVSNGAATDSYGGKTLSTFFLFDTNETQYIAPALPFSKNVLVSLTNKSSITAANLDFNPNALTTVNVGAATGDTGANTLTATTVTNNGTINVRNGSTVSTSDTGYWAFDNNKTLLVDGAGSKILGTVSNGHVAAGTATVSNSASIGTADNLSKYVINYAGSTFDVTTGATINASELQNGGVFTIDGANLNVGKLTHRKDQGGSFTVKGASTLKIGTLVAETDNMYGPINVADGATLSATSIKGEGTVVFDAATTGTNQGITLSGNNTITAAIKNNGTITGNGALTAGDITNGIETTTVVVDRAMITAGSINAVSLTNNGTVGSQEDGKKLDSLTLTGALNNSIYSNVYVVHALNAGSIDNAGGIDVGSIETGDLENKTTVVGDKNVAGLITATIIDAASIVNAGKINAGDKGTITTTGTLTNSGTIEDAGTLYVGKTASATQPVTYTYTGTLTNTGAVTADNIYAGLVSNGSEPNVNTNNESVKIISESISGASISNYGTIKAESIAIDAGGDGVKNAGTIEVKGTSDARGSFNVGTKKATNTNGTIVLDKADLTGATIEKGTINAINGSVIYNTTDYSSINLTGSTVNAAQVDATSGAKFKVLSSTDASELHISTFIGTIELENGAKLKNSDVTRYNVVSYAAAVTIAAGAEVEFVGTNAFTKNANAPADAEFNFTNSGTLTVNATLPIDAANLTVDGTFVNNGTITINTSSLEITGKDPVVIKVISFAKYEGSLTSKITVDNTDKYEVLVNRDNISLFYKGSVPVDKSTLVVNHAWSEEPYGKEVMFGVEKGEPVYYRVGINAFDSANELINLTDATKKIKFAKSTSNNYGDLTLTNSTDITVWDSVGLVEGGTVILKNFTVIGSGKDKTRLNIAESAPADTTVQIKAVNDVGGNVTITDADVDFDNAITVIDGAVTITGSEVEFDTATSIGGKLTIDENSKVEADQGGVFALTSTTAVSEIDGELLVSKGTDATLKTVTGTGKIYTDINSKLSFTATEDAAFITSIDVTGLTKDAGKTFDTNGRAIDKFVATGEYAKGIGKYFTVATAATSSYDVGDLIQITGACYEYKVTSATDITTAVKYTWNNVDHADNVVLVDSVNATSAAYFEGIEDQVITINGGNYTSVYGGTKIVNESTDKAYSTKSVGIAKKAINVTINDGTFSKVVVGGDVANTTEKATFVIRQGDIKLTVNGGTFKAGLAVGEMIYNNTNMSQAILAGNANLTITGGTFESKTNTDGSISGWVYGGNFANKIASSARTLIDGKATVTIKAGEVDEIDGKEIARKIDIQAGLVVGSYGNGSVSEGTELILTGEGTAENLKIKEIWGGNSGDYYEKSSREYVSYGGDFTRTLTFTGFSGELNCDTIRGFSDVSVKKGTKATLNDDTFGLADVNNWTFELGSELNGAFQNDFAGDTLTLAGIANMEKDWVICDDITNFAFEGIKSINGVTGEALEFDNNAYKFNYAGNQYQLSFGDYTTESEETLNAMYLTRILA